MVPRPQRCQCAQRPQLAGQTGHPKVSSEPFRRTRPSCQVRERPCPSCHIQIGRGPAQQAGSQSEQKLTACRKSLAVRLGLQQLKPSVFKARELGAANAARQQFTRDALKPWLGRRRTDVESVQLIAPPGEFNRRKIRLASPKNDFGQGVIEAEQGIESRPKLRRPMQPGEVAVAQFSDSRRLSLPSRRRPP